MMNTSTVLDDNFSTYIPLEPCYILRPLGYYLLFIWLTGSILNGFILCVFIRHKHLRQTSTNIFICGLIVADLIGAGVAVSLPAVAMLNCKWLFGYVGCVIEAIIAYFAGCSNMYLLCLISIDRYFVVTRSFSTSVITVKQAYIITLCAYLLALFWTLMPLIGWSSYDYEGTGASCSIKWEDRSLNVISYNMAILIFVYLIPVIIIITTNIIAIRVIRERRRRTSTNLHESHAQRQFFVERRITYTIIFIIAGFLIAWTPYALVVCIQAFVRVGYFPSIYGTLPAIFAKTSVVWNPLIYVARNGNIRQYIPCFRERRNRQENRASDPTYFSARPLSTVQLPLTSTPNSRQE